MGAPARIPPAELIAGVEGCPDSARFEQAGRMEALDIFAAVNDRVSLEHPLKILDFGCGCGHVLRYMGELAPAASFHALDFSAEAASWCAANYPTEVRRGRFIFVAADGRPPAKLCPDYFDVVYAASAFTRLPEDQQHRWLAELRRVAKPEGLLVIAAQGDAAARRQLSAEDRRSLEQQGFLFKPRGGAGGHPQPCGAAWHTRAYIDRVWSKYLRVAGHIPAGMAGDRDLVLCVKPRHTVI